MGEDSGAGAGANGTGDGDEEAPKEGGLGSGGGGYVPPHLRKGGAASSGERMGGKYERDDLATLRVTNVSHPAEQRPFSAPSWFLFTHTYMGSFRLLTWNTCILGLRIRRRRRSSSYIRALRTRHKSIPGQRSGIRAG